MTIFIGQEYIIGLSLITRQAISVAELNELSNTLQIKLNESNVDAIAISHDWQERAYGFPEYFTVVNDYILRACNVTPKCLEHRFLGYLPLNVLVIMKQVLNKEITYDT